MGHHHRARLATLAAMGAVGYCAYRLASEAPRRAADSAPGYTARRSLFGGYKVTGQTVTIAAPRAHLYAFWRELSNLPRFMENVHRIEPLDADRSAWTVAATGGGEVRLVTRIVEDRPNESLAWSSTPDSPVRAEGKVTFRDAPDGRGTVVKAIVSYRPPFGIVGHWIAKAFRRSPDVQGRQELKRLKMLVETGEIATAWNRRES